MHDRGQRSAGHRRWRSRHHRRTRHDFGQRQRCRSTRLGGRRHQDGRTGVLIADNTIVGNGAPGIWTDGTAAHVAIDNNTLRGNTGGIHVEISRYIDVTDNSVSGSRNGAVLVVSSMHVNVSGNTIQNNQGGGVLVGGVGRRRARGRDFGPRPGHAQSHQPIRSIGPAPTAARHRDHVRLESLCGGSAAVGRSSCDLRRAAGHRPGASRDLGTLSQKFHRIPPGIHIVHRIPRGARPTLAG